MTDPDIVDAYLANKGLEQLESYLRRGRRFVNNSIETLRACWVKEMQARAKNYRQEFDHCTREDIEAEFRLRKEEPPLDDVREAMEALKQASRDHIEELMRDPARFNEKAEAIEEAIRNFEETTKAEKN